MRNPWVLFLAFILAFAASLWGVGPWLSTHQGDGAANLAFVMLRVIALPLFGFLLAWNCGKGRGFSLAATTLLAFCDLVLLKLVFVALQAYAHPADWQGLGLGMAFVGVMTSYIFFLPGVFLLGFLGVEIAMTRKESRRARGLPSPA